MKISPIVLILIGFALGMVVTLRRREPSQPKNAEPLITTHSVEIIYDTIHIHDIEPISVTPIETDDTTTIIPPLNLYSFQDSTAEQWSAKIIGRDVELKSITLHNQIEQHHIIKHQPPRWQITAQTDLNNFSQWIGIVATHNLGNMQISAQIGYNPQTASTIYGGSIGIRLWSWY